MIDTNLCNIDTLLDTKAELENMYWQLLNEEHSIKQTALKLHDLATHVP